MTDRLPRRLLHLEGLAILVGSLVLYFHAGYGWLLLVVLFRLRISGSIACSGTG